MPPKSTTYEEQVALINIPRSTEPVFIGVVGVDNSKKKEHGCLDDEQSRWNNRHCVLRPEKFLNCDWTAKLNKAFMEGAILSGRPIHLVTNFKYFDKFDNNGLAGNGVFYELLALQENSYVFHKEGNRIVATRPPQALQASNLHLDMFDDYASIKDPSISKEKRADKCKEVAITRADEIKYLRDTFNAIQQGRAPRQSALGINRSIPGAVSSPQTPSSRPPIQNLQATPTSSTSPSFQVETPKPSTSPSTIVTNPGLQPQKPVSKMISLKRTPIPSKLSAPLALGIQATTQMPIRSPKAIASLQTATPTSSSSPQPTVVQQQPRRIIRLKTPSSSAPPVPAPGPSLSPGQPTTQQTNPGATRPGPSILTKFRSDQEYQKRKRDEETTLTAPPSKQSKKDDDAEEKKKTGFDLK